MASSRSQRPEPATLLNRLSGGAIQRFFARAPLTFEFSQECFDRFRQRSALFDATNVLDQRSNHCSLLEGVPQRDAASHVVYIQRADSEPLSHAIAKAKRCDKS